MAVLLSAGLGEDPFLLVVLCEADGEESFEGEFEVGAMLVHPLGGVPSVDGSSGPGEGGFPVLVVVDGLRRPSCGVLGYGVGELDEQEINLAVEFVVGVESEVGAEVGVLHGECDDQVDGASGACGHAAFHRCHEVCHFPDGHTSSAFSAIRRRVSLTGLCVCRSSVSSPAVVVAAPSEFISSSSCASWRMRLASSTVPRPSVS